jgi:acetyl-CoA synthetase
MDSEDPLFMLYTSGSTGKPKGLVHTQAGYLLQVALSHQVLSIILRINTYRFKTKKNLDFIIAKLVFNYKAEENEVFGCLADVGWITGHSYVVYGPLCNGGTTVLFESTPIYPNPGRYWETVDRLKINQLYLAPTSLRLLHKFGNEWVKKYSRETLKCLGSGTLN